MLKFKSRKDLLFKVIAFGFPTLFIGILIIKVSVYGFPETSFYISGIFIALTSVLLLWIYFQTYYQLSPSKLIYKSGPLKGEIEIKSIREIEKEKTLWSGLKPATARKGLIIKYNRFDEIYISPLDNNIFIEKILELNPNIKIVD
ncbi:PH domain-containing protein [Mesonia sp.]|uniref:PH domain-containing protein n=1 Tax=Mesonia sp. TaxID=1960830 RepID=UPI001756324D|nr:PH domain-containing protein [Mesonia sp.]HIB37557.1 hypothetical protein [Mesonia sp.]HIO27038.1 hypothetical protein [Flavobacteriaceae bacterium]